MLKIRGMGGKMSSSPEEAFEHCQLFWPLLRLLEPLLASLEPPYKNVRTTSGRQQRLPNYGYPCHYKHTLRHALFGSYLRIGHAEEKQRRIPPKTKSSRRKLAGHSNELTEGGALDLMSRFEYSRGTLRRQFGQRRR